MKKYVMKVLHNKTFIWSAILLHMFVLLFVQPTPFYIDYDVRLFGAIGLIPGSILWLKEIYKNPVDVIVETQTIEILKRREKAWVQYYENQSRAN